METQSGQNPANREKILNSVETALLASSRDTDLVGWYQKESAIGVMFTGLIIDDKNAMLNTIFGRISNSLREELTLDQFSKVNISLHLFPDDWNHEEPGRASNSALYPDLHKQDKKRKPLLVLKRTIDVAGSLLLCILCAPLCLIIALVIKASSEGPVLFRQKRVGQYGRCFTFLKFRSMYVNNDHSVHKEYVTKLIARQAERVQSDRNNGGVFKLANDKRVTRIGKFLRKSSLDELPQFLNVLIGDMSLVGPRPPIPYELAAYQTWHRRRLLEVKPGITGLWQVTGRSQVDFDEMVRLDLRYATSWTPWLDVKILIRTPLAVVKGSGAC
jgi:lipopolysaccharide/colanic/teichoic acid biosynthesis glycosyltransferase